MLSNDTLAGCGGIKLGFFTRAGGVSKGLYASLNCGLGSNDDADAVRENRSLAMAAMALPVMAGIAAPVGIPPLVLMGTVAIACSMDLWEPRAMSTRTPTN